MDQLKEILRQAIKYRFWIAVGISALLPMIAYFLGVGAVKEEAVKKTGEITKADTAVQKYSSGTPINGDYKPVVADKTEALTKDVQNTWKKLYDRQKNLLKWPERVHESLTKWGRAWPDAAVADSSKVHAVVVDYIEAYPKVVTEVYKTCNPFDPVDGKGVVAAPPEAELLHPATFDQAKPPSLGKVWGGQERLWVQRALLEVIATVNKAAKDWDGAIIKQINLLNVGTPSAQDQQSLAKAEQAEKAPDIVDPNKPAESTESADSGGMAQMAAMYAHSMGGGGSAMGGGAQTEEVYYIHTDSTQFKIMPVQLSVLIEQNHIQDLLIALENSPMSVQVMDFEMGKPEAKVAKPERGQNMGGYGMYAAGGMMGNMMTNMMKGMGGYGGNYMRSMRGMMDAGAMAAMSGSAMGYGGPMGGGAAAERKGVDKRSEDVAKKHREQEQAVKKSGATALHDPYYNIVEVTVYGKARFFNPPPTDAPAEPSQSEAAGAQPAPAEAAAKEEAAPKAEAPKAEAPKAEAPKAETPKAETPKAAAPKTEAPKAAVPKPDAPKAEAGAPKKS